MKWIKNDGVDRSDLTTVWGTRFDKRLSTCVLWDFWGLEGPHQDFLL